jgi:hypothetical protein
MSTGEYVSLSEQQIMDCSWNYGYNSACNGGDPDLGVQYAIENGGSYKEFDYPYKGELAETQQQVFSGSRSIAVRNTSLLIF